MHFPHACAHEQQSAGATAIGEEESFADGEEEEEYEVEEFVDDVPMPIVDCVYVGSIDAACNMDALEKARIGFVLSLLGSTEDANTLLGVDQNMLNITLSDTLSNKTRMQRRVIPMEDSLDEEFLGKLPGILNELNALIDDASREGKNVLVHCVAGRSRSPAVVVAWMVAKDPHNTTIQEAIEHIKIIRPWIEINPHFMKELLLFQEILTTTEYLNNLENLRKRKLPRLDFAPSLVSDILIAKKTITMRLLSDIENDKNSDLQLIFPHALVIAMSAPSPAVEGEGSVDFDRSSTDRRPFALLRIDHITTKALCDIDATELHKSGFAMQEELLVVLRQFYPNVTVQTPLRMLHFRCIGLPADVHVE